ncbi:MAG TPA: hypothetical protein VMT93_06745 [Gemmatimonadaceae bacterium]|nr:hypothetical protein [Gemmatimonadaceae bacterium]
MKRVAVIAAVLAVAACKGKEAPSMDTIAKPAPAPAAAMDTGMKKMDSGMMKADTSKKMAAPAAAPAPAPAPAAAPAKPATKKP